MNKGATRRKRWKKNTEFTVNPKLSIKVPHLINRIKNKFPISSKYFMSKYRPQFHELNQKYELHCNEDLSVNISQIDPRTYLALKNPPPIPDNEMELIRKDFVEPTDLQSLRKTVDLNVTWLRRTSYITKYSGNKKRVTEMDRQKYLSEKRMKELERKKIDKPKAAAMSFVEAQSAEGLTHPTKKNLTPLWVMPILPDTELADNTYVDGVLDGNPIEGSTRFPGPEKFQQIRASKAFFGNVRKIKKFGGEEYVCGSYLVPRRLKPQPQGEPETFVWVKDFKITVNNFPFGRQEPGGEIHPVSNIVIMINEEKKVATYCPITARININHLPAENIVHKNNPLRVKRRALNQAELDEIKSKRENEFPGVPIKKDSNGEMTN